MSDPDDKSKRKSKNEPSAPPHSTVTSDGEEETDGSAIRSESTEGFTVQEELSSEQTSRVGSVAPHNSDETPTTAPPTTAEGASGGEEPPKTGDNSGEGTTTSGGEGVTEKSKSSPDEDKNAAGGETPAAEDATSVAKEGEAQEEKQKRPSGEAPRKSGGEQGPSAEAPRKSGGEQGPSGTEGTESPEEVESTDDENVAEQASPAVDSVTPTLTPTDDGSTVTGDLSGTTEGDEEEENMDYLKGMDLAQGMSNEELAAEEREFRVKYALDLEDDGEQTSTLDQPENTEITVDDEEEEQEPTEDQMKAIIEFLEEEKEAEEEEDERFDMMSNFGDKIRTKIRPKDDTTLDTQEDGESGDESADTGSAATSQAAFQGEDEPNVMVLGPDHPKMVRFQQALKAHLERQIYLAECEARNLENDLKTKRKERTELGNNLYNLQHEILRQSELMEKYEKDMTRMREKREKTESATKALKLEVDELKDQSHKEECKEMGLRESQKTLDFTEHVVRQAAEQYSGELKIRHLIAEKLVKMRTKSEAEKRDQDFYLDKVLTHLQHMELTNAGLKRQVLAHREEQAQLNTYINEAVTEIEALHIEKAHLQRAWNDTIGVVRARDDALKAARETLDKTREELRARESELRSIARTISKEQEAHEQSVILLKRRKMEERVLRNQLRKLTEENERLKDSLATLNKIRKTVEVDLLRANNAHQRKEKEVGRPRRELEHLAQEKTKIEDQILAILQEQSGLNKAAAHIQRLIKEARNKTRTMEMEVARVENENSKLAIDVEVLRSDLLRKSSQLTELEKRCNAQERTLQDQMKDILQSERVIQKKTGEVEQLNRKLEKLITQQGGIEMGPLEREIENLEKQIVIEKETMNKLQEEWLRRQDDLVRLSSQRDYVIHQNEILGKEVFIMERKRQRLDSEVEEKKLEIAKVRKATEGVRAEITAVNGKLHMDRSNHDQMDKDNILIQNELQALLKDAEMEAVELETEIRGLEDEKLNLVEKLREVHEQNLQWEKKVKLAKELKDNLRKEQEGSNSSLKMDIHHMQVRYNEIARAQEKLISDLERSVERRDRIIAQADLKLQRDHVNPKHTKLNIQRNFASIKERNRLLVREANEIEQQVRSTMDSIHELENKLTAASNELNKVRERIQGYEEKIADASVLKHKNLVEIVLRQEKFRVLESIKYMRYKPSGRSLADIQRQLEDTEKDCMAVVTMADEVGKEYPETQLHLKLVKASILPGVNASLSQ